MRIFYLLFLLSIFSNATELKIASYNVENLFDMHQDGTEYPAYIPNQHNWTTTTLNKKLTNISEVICDMDADIIGLQEIENKNALQLLQKSLKKYGCNYKYSAITYKQKSAIQIALLSKIPIQNAKDVVVTRAWGIRNILETKFIIDGKPLYIFVNHWNSKKSSDKKRIISALALKKRLTRLPKGSAYILLGDFNVHYNEYNVNRILKTMTQDKQMVRVCHISNSAHYNLWLEEPIYRRWSHNFYGQKQSLDAIWIPPTLMDGKGIEYINDSFDILKKSYLFHKKGYIQRWQYQKGRHKGIGYSDHLPIFARFSTKPYIRPNCKIKSGLITELLQKNIQLPIKLQSIKVIDRFKNGVHIKQNNSNQTIALYGIDRVLVVGEVYDIIVYKRKLYQDRYEIVDFGVIY